MPKKKTATVKEVNAVIVMVSDNRGLLPSQGRFADGYNRRQQKLLRLIADDNGTDVEHLHLLGPETALSPQAHECFLELCFWLKGEHSAFKTLLEGNKL